MTTPDGTLQLTLIRAENDAQETITIDRAKASRGLVLSLAGLAHTHHGLLGLVRGELQALTTDVEIRRFVSRRSQVTLYVTPKIDPVIPRVLLSTEKRIGQLRRWFGAA